jgi:glycosyltransferase involved in cell wall biosynthesis
LVTSFQAGIASTQSPLEPSAEHPGKQALFQKKPVVLHLTADYPDAHRRETTLAVKNFVDANAQVDHIIISLNRTTLPWRQNLQAGDGQGDTRVIAIRYWGLPLGVQLAASMYVLARKVRRILARRGLRPDLIHAHKLTFEGLAGYWLSRWLNVPLVCSIRGEVEQKVFRFKPHYDWLYRKVLRHCDHIYYVSAWSRPAIQRKLALAAEKQSLLPNFVRLDTIHARETFTPDRLVSILHLDVYKKKGLDRLLPALHQTLERFPELKLDLIGRGEPATFSRLERLIEEQGVTGHVRLNGPLGHAELLRRLPDYAAMVLPSHNETFGMAYVEALLSGVPVLYSRGTGIDGYLDDIPAAIGVDPRSIASIRDGLIELLTRQHAFRAWLLANQPLLKDRFASKGYIQKYNQNIDIIAKQERAGTTPTA